MTTALATWRRRAWVALLASCLLSSACGGSGGADARSSVAGAARATEFASGLETPWGLAFLPDGSMLVTERAGRMRRVSADGRQVSAPIGGLPAVYANGQGGLLDVAVDPDYASNGWIYWSYSEAGSGNEAGTAGTAVARGKLVNLSLQSVEAIFRQSPKVPGSSHFGCRLVFAADKTLFITLGERQKDDPAHPDIQNAQNLGKHLGKVVRINRDGSLPTGNPNFGVAGALPQIWSYGHRNPQGAALNPTTGELWVVEHGPRGGDELNRIQPGHNYGWPLRSYGCPYSYSEASDACRVGGGKHAPNFDEPLTYWVPISTAPSGMAFYSGQRFPEWQGNLFIGALAGQTLWRLTLSGNTVVSREALLTDLHERIRDVRLGPDGYLYLLTDNSRGRILRVER